MTTTSLEATVIDLKCPIAEYLPLTPIQIGTTYYLSELGITVFEVSEDWAVWIKGYRKEISGDHVQVEFTLVFTEPTGLFEKPALLNIPITFKYKVSELPVITLDDPMTKYVRLKVSQISEIALAEAKLGGQAAAEAIAKALPKLKR